MAQQSFAAFIFTIRVDSFRFAFPTLLSNEDRKRRKSHFIYTYNSLCVACVISLIFEQTKPTDELERMRLMNFCGEFDVIPYERNEKQCSDNAWSM